MCNGYNKELLKLLECLKLSEYKNSFVETVKKYENTEYMNVLYNILVENIFEPNIEKMRNKLRAFMEHIQYIL
jgi:hypothetical protein